MSAPSSIGSSSFGALLRQLRKRAGMTQGDLAAAVGYSVSSICDLEQARRLPVVAGVTDRFVAALGLQDEPLAAARLIELAAIARGERPPAPITQPQTQSSFQQEGARSDTHLPSLPAELFGGNSEVDQLCRRLLGHNGRLLTLVGPPGIGKTTMAIAVATRLQGRYQDGTAFVPLAAVEHVDLMASAIATTVGSYDAGPKPLQTRLIEFLRRKQMLLVLDNLEQITRRASLVAALVAECPGLCILATSRERLHLRAKQRYMVPPLDLAAAVELFTERAQAVNHNFQHTPHNQHTLEEICRRLDCLPLALELCAAQADLLSPAQLLAQLKRQPLALLVDGAHDLPPHQRTLRTAIRYSYELLDDEGRGLLRRLGVFVGGFEIGAVQAMHGSVAQLRDLVAKNLVRVETQANGELRYFLLETIREFALEQLRGQNEEQQTRERHFAEFLDLFRRGDRYLRGSEYLAWLDRLKPEQDNLRAALQWALDTTRYTDAAWLMLSASYFSSSSGNGYEEARWHAQLLPHCHTLTHDVCLTIMLGFYRAAFALEEFQPMVPTMDEIMQLLEGCPYKLLHATAWSFHAWSAADAAQAAAYLERGIALAHEASAPPVLGEEFGAHADRNFILGVHLWGYAALLTDQGQAVRAALIAKDSLRYFQKSGNQTGIGECKGILGHLALWQGNIARARKLLEEAVAIATTLNISAMQREWQALLAIATLYDGDAEEARRLLTESLRRCLDQKNPIVLAQICTCLAEVALAEGDLDQAEHCLEQSLFYYATPHAISIDEVERLAVAARVAAARQDYGHAAVLLGQVQGHSQRFDAVTARWVNTRMDAALAAVQAPLGAERFATALAYGRALAAEGRIDHTAAPIPASVVPPNQASPAPPVPGMRKSNLARAEP